MDWLIAFWILMAILGLLGLKKIGGAGCLVIIFVAFVIYTLKWCHDYEVEEKERQEKLDEAAASIRRTKMENQRIKEKYSTQQPHN